MSKTIKLREIPIALLPTLTNSEKTPARIYLRGRVVESIVIFNKQYRIYAGGEHRYPLDTNVVLEIY